MSADDREPWTLAAALNELLAAFGTMRGRPQAGLHVPVCVTFRDHGTPADVCWGCSDPDGGAWVPVTECEVALEVYETAGPVSYPRFDEAEDREIALDAEYDERYEDLEDVVEERLRDEC